MPKEKFYLNCALVIFKNIFVEILSFLITCKNICYPFFYLLDLEYGMIYNQMHGNKMDLVLHLLFFLANSFVL